MTVEPVRVLQVVTKMDCGGLETFVMNMYRHMDRERIQFDFLCHRHGDFAYDDEIRSLGGHIYAVPRCNPLDPGYFQALEKFYAVHPYRVVHSHIDCMSAFPLAAAAKYGAAVRVAHSHSSRQDKDLKYPLKLICRHRIAHEATHLFACGEEAGKWMFCGASFNVVRNGVDVGSYAYRPKTRKDVRVSLDIPADALVIGHVGRFDAVKNQVFLVETFTELLKVRPDAVLVLVGDGRTRPAVERRAVELGVSGSVRFLGLRSDVADLMQAMDVFCMPSLYEGLPLVLVEAQAAGLKCVISVAIPRDCDIVPGAVSRLPLSSGPITWAQGLLDAATGVQDRSLGALKVRDAGFDAAEVAAHMQDFYLTGIWNDGRDK